MTPSYTKKNKSSCTKTYQYNWNACLIKIVNTEKNNTTPQELYKIMTGYTEVNNSSHPGSGRKYGYGCRFRLTFDPSVRFKIDPLKQRIIYSLFYALSIFLSLILYESPVILII